MKVAIEEIKTRKKIILNKIKRGKKWEQPTKKVAAATTMNEGKELVARRVHSEISKKIKKRIGN